MQEPTTSTDLRGDNPVRPYIFAEGTGDLEEGLKSVSGSLPQVTKEIEEIGEAWVKDGRVDGRLLSPTRHSSLFSFKWNDLAMQFVALIVAVVFGVWGIKSYGLAQNSLQQSLIANQVALLSFCASSQNPNHDPACSIVLQAVNLQNIAESLGLSSVTPSTSSRQPPSVNFNKCMAEVRQRIRGNEGGTDSHGQPVANISQATAITYDLCVEACGTSSEAFVWSSFSQQFGAWFLPWLALVSNLPFVSSIQQDNVISVFLVVLRAVNLQNIIESFGLSSVWRSTSSSQPPPPPSPTEALSNAYFRTAVGDAMTCLECPMEREYLYSAEKIYLDAVARGSEDWLVETIVDGLPDVENVTEALKSGSCGKYVYESDNDVCDHQIVNIEFLNGGTASFTMVAFTSVTCERKLRMHFIHGEIVGNMSKFTMTDFWNNHSKDHHLRFEGGDHGGGRPVLIRAFLEAVRTCRRDVLDTDISEVLESHFRT